MKRIISVILLTALAVASAAMLSSCGKPKEELRETDGYYYYENVSYGDAKRHLLDVVLPKNVSGEVGLILAIHGGGWRAGDKDSYDSELISWCEEHGYVAAAMNYRYATERGVDCDAMLDDITAALTEIKQIASEHNINTERVMMYGGSAGAHLALQYSYKMRDVSPITPAAVCSMSGPTDLLDKDYFKADNKHLDGVITMFRDLCNVKFNADTVESVRDELYDASPIKYVDGECCPTIICQGDVDDIVPLSNAITLEKCLAEAGVTHELIIFDNSGHGLENDAEASELMWETMREYARLYLSAK